MRVGKGAGFEVCCGEGRGGEGGGVRCVVTALRCMAAVFFGGILWIGVMARAVVGNDSHHFWLDGENPSRYGGWNKCLTTFIQFDYNSHDES